MSRKFSSKFYAFFRKVILNGRVLGDVTHYYWKKEYQARDVHHYHVHLWIHGAPVIDRDDLEDVLSWIQNRITCCICKKESNPELHRLVTLYQMHKCSAYCKCNMRLVLSTSIIEGFHSLIKCPHLPNSIRSVNVSNQKRESTSYPGQSWRLESILQPPLTLEG